MFLVNKPNAPRYDSVAVQDLDHPVHRWVPLSSLVLVWERMKAVGRLENMFAPGEADMASVAGCGLRAASDGRQSVQCFPGRASGNPCRLQGALMGLLQPRNLSGSAGFG